MEEDEVFLKFRLNFMNVNYIPLKGFNLTFYQTFDPAYILIRLILYILSVNFYFVTLHFDKFA